MTRTKTNKKTVEQEMELFCDTHQYQTPGGGEFMDTSPVEEEDDE